MKLKTDVLVNVRWENVIREDTFARLRSLRHRFFVVPQNLLYLDKFIRNCSWKKDRGSMLEFVWDKHEERAKALPCCRLRQIGNGNDAVEKQRTESLDSQEREAESMKMKQSMVCGSQQEVLAVSINMPGKSVYDFTPTAVRVGERILQAVRQSPVGTVFGMELRSKAFGWNDKLQIFSSPEAEVTREDIAWMFESCAEKAPVEEEETLRDMHEEERRVYGLCETEERVAVKKELGLYEQERNYYKTQAELRSLYHLLEQEGAWFRIAVIAGEAGSAVRGNLFFSLSSPISLRLRSALTLVFPRTRLVEFSEQSEELPTVSSACLLDGMTKLFLLAADLYLSGKKEQADSELSEEWQEEENTFVDPKTFKKIEDLELSVRSSYCLKRAGITTIAELKKLSEEELLKIRNMGRKSVFEIQDKLRELMAWEATETEQKSWEVDYREKLDALIGLVSVKEQVRELVAFSRLQQDLRAHGKKEISMALNMAFCGNPGTAKTTVARILAGVLCELDILKSPEVVEVGRSQLVGSYLGQTAEKVRAMFEKAEGKLLFIDEAYSLLDSYCGGYGEEAINTVVQEMENRREDTVVVFAGYTEPMREFLASNPGLGSRVPFQFQFEDYSADELVQIATLLAEQQGFQLLPATREVIRKLVEPVVRQAVYGNGRYCRNLVEKAIRAYALRVYPDGMEQAMTHTYTLLPEDFRNPSGLKKSERRNIGFQVNVA